MFKNYLKIAIRNLSKNKGYSLINILGLAIGMTSCVLILLYVQDELSYDKFHTKRERIYRVNKLVTPQTGGTEYHAITPGLMGPAMVNDFPEVEQSVRLLPWFSDVLMTHAETTLKVSDVVIADANFFEVFDFKLIQGDPKTALVEPLSMVLTSETARNFFGDADPMGQVMTGFRDELYTITGIIEEAPANSHLPYHVLISWSSTVPGVGPLKMAWLNRWITQVNFTYLMLSPGADVASFDQKFPEFMQKYMPRHAAQYHLYLQPLSDIYLKSSKLKFTHNTRLGNFTYVYMFSVIAVLILLIACINFMNLSTARATKRAKEVGVRKVLGAYRNQLAKQFLGESFLVSFLALIIVVTFVELILTQFNSFAGKNLDFDLLGNPLLFWGLLGLTLFVGFLSGFYPALLLSGFRPVQVLKGHPPLIPPSRGDSGRCKGSGNFRSALVTMQFAISIALIAGTLVVFQQMHYMQTKNLGFHKEQIVVLPIGKSEISDQSQAFKNELLQHPNITHAAGSNSVPGGSMMSFGIRPEGKPENEDWQSYAIRIDDDDLLKTYGMEMAAGRYFSSEFSTDTTAVVINETLAKSLGWQDPVGKGLDISGELNEGKIIGVIKDFHMSSLHQPINPMLIYFLPRWENLSVRITSHDIPGTLKFLEQKWQEFESKYPFEYIFVDQTFAQFYQAEERLAETFGLFSALAIFIASLGLLGLAAFTSEQRTKEIGVRKVLGATATSIIFLLSKDFSRLVLVAFILAVPVAYLVMTSWLQDFAYRINITFWTFIFAGAMAFLIALFTISFQALKAALSNPVEALRYE